MPEPILTEQDQKELARLVAKYTPEIVSRAALVVPKPKSGRRSKGSTPRFERIHLAQWLDERADEHKAKGSRQFARDAIFDLFEMKLDEVEQREQGRFEAFEKTTKKKWHQGRRELIEMLETAAASEHFDENERASAQREIQKLRREK